MLWKQRFAVFKFEKLFASKFARWASLWTNKFFNNMVEYVDKYNFRFFLIECLEKATFVNRLDVFSSRRKLQPAGLWEMVASLHKNLQYVWVRGQK